MNKIIDKLDKIRLELKKKALVNGDTKCARMEYELGKQIMELMSAQTVLDATEEILDKGASIVPSGAIHEELKKLKNR
jgi:hypothetical protein